MSDLKPEVSKKNPYWIPKHRYYELVHFCLQYPTWVKAYNALDGLSKRPEDLALFKTNEHGNPTERCAESRAYFAERIDIVKNAALLAGGLGILDAVTQGIPYEAMSDEYRYCNSREKFYKVRRKFFYILDQTRK